MQPRRRNPRRSVARWVEVEVCGTWILAAHLGRHRRRHGELERARVSGMEMQCPRRREAGAQSCLLGRAFHRPLFASDFAGSAPGWPARNHSRHNPRIAPSARRGQRICPSAMPSCALADTPATSWGRGYCSHHPALDGYPLLHFRATGSLHWSCFTGPKRQMTHSSKKGTGIFPVPFKTSCLAVLRCSYVVPAGISRGELILSTIALKIAVSLVRFWLLGAVASQPSPSSE
jgi:hypothetical protein